MFHTKKYNRGLSIAEMILALALFALLIPSSAMLIMSGYSAYGFAQQRHHHFVLAKSELDAYIAGHTFKSPFLNASSSHYVEGGIAITTTRIPRSIFAVQVSVTVVDTRLPLNMQYRSNVTLSQIMVDNNYPNTDSCELYLSPAEKLPAIHEMGGLGIDPTNPLTGLVVRFPYAFITADGTATSSPDLYVVNISSSTQPTVLNSLDTGRGLVDAVIAYPYLYAVTSFTTQHIQIFNISNPQTPQLVKTFRLPNFGSSTAPLATTISYFNSNLYIGTEKWLGPELEIISVADPLHPQYISGLEIGAKIKDIEHWDTRAFVATAGEQELIEVDISNPATPQKVGYFTSSGWQVQEGNRIAIESSISPALYFGRAGGGFNNVAQHEFFTLLPTSDISSSSKSLDIPSGVYGIVPYYPYIILATASSGSEILIKDIRPSNLASSTVSNTLSMGSHLRQLICDERVVYGIREGDNSVRILTIFP